MERTVSPTLLLPFGQADNVDFSINILRKGDSVLNVFTFDDKLAVSVKRKAGQVEVFLVSKDEQGLPRITNSIKIAEGNNTIDLTDGDVTVSTG